MNAPLSPTEWLIVASVAVAAIGLLVAYYGWRTRPREERWTYTLRGPNITLEMRQVFGPYGQLGVQSLIVMQDGIRVGYGDGKTIRFVPLPDGATLYVNQEGEFTVEPPALGG